MYSGTLRRPQSNRKKNVIIAAIIVVVCLSAFGGLFYIFKCTCSKDRPDEIGRSPGENCDGNTPNPAEQLPEEIMAYMASAEFRKLDPRQQLEYMRQSDRKVREYQMGTYFFLPADQRTAYLDSVINWTLAQQQDLEQIRQNRPPRRPLDANDPDMQRRRQLAGQLAARRSNPSNVCATAIPRTQREAFMQAMQQRMQQRGMSMPRPGSP
jgi:hypothetical protein